MYKEKCGHSQNKKEILTGVHKSPHMASTANVDQALLDCSALYATCWVIPHLLPRMARIHKKCQTMTQNIYSLQEQNFIE